MKWFGVGVVCLMVVGFARPALAQDAPKAEVSLGYNWMGVKQSGEDELEKFPKGWYFDVSGSVTPMVSIVGQVTGNYKHFDDDDFDLKLHTFMAGVRGSSPGPVSGYGQFLVGGASIKASDDIDSASETDLAIQIGGGVTMRGSGPVGFRVGVDYLRIQAKDDGDVLGGEGLNGFRFAVGVTFGIGR